VKHDHDRNITLLLEYIQTTVCLLT